jgi:SsrA-binding protein
MLWWLVQAFFQGKLAYFLVPRRVAMCYNLPIMPEKIATNKKAFRDYFLTDTWECGIELKGGEVKSIRAGHVNFKDSFARVDKGEVYLYNLHIEVYERSGYDTLEADRKRKLLLHRKEIKKIEGLTVQRGFSLVPTKLYFSERGMVKLEIALGKPKKIYDKRETIKKRKLDRDISRVLRSSIKGAK